MNLYPRHYDDDAVSTCGDCHARFKAGDLDPIKDPSQRLSSGDPLPAGECLRCGSLSYVGNPEHDDKMLKFAVDVLNILDNQKDWSASTLDYIADSARDFGLAKDDGEGFFKKLEEVA